MVTPVLDALALEVILGLPSGTEINIPDFMTEINRHLPAEAAVRDAGAVGEVAEHLATIGYLQVGRDEPALYRVP